MKYLQTFESYLKGGREPLYHWTHNLEAIIKTNTLKCGNPSYGINDKEGNTIKSISVSRSSYYSLDRFGSTRIVLDSDLLRKDGYISYPFEEVAFSNKDSYKISRKSTPKKWELRTNKRIAIHNIDNLHKLDPEGLEIEYEERFYSNIENIGKYIIYIDFTREQKIIDYIKRDSDFINFLIKHPTIKVRLINRDKLYLPAKEINISNYLEIPLSSASS